MQDAPRQFLACEVETLDDPSEAQIAAIKDLASRGVVGNWAFVSALNIDLPTWLRWRRSDDVRHALCTGRGSLEVAACKLLMDSAADGEAWAIKRLADAVAPGVSSGDAQTFEVSAEEEQLELDLQAMTDAELERLTQQAGGVKRVIHDAEFESSPRSIQDPPRS